MRLKMKRPTAIQLRTSLDNGSFFEHYEKMIFNIAHKMKKLHKGEDFDELVAEGYYGIASKAHEYDPTKADVSTWAYTIIWGRMKNLCINKATHRHVPTDFTEKKNDIVAPVKDNWFATLVRELSEDAGLLVRAACEAPGELASVVRDTAPKKSRKALHKYLAKTLGWNKVRINSAWKEVELCL